MFTKCDPSFIIIVINENPNKNFALTEEGYLLTHEGRPGEGEKRG
jgi:hypothetical protein